MTENESATGLPVSVGDGYHWLNQELFFNQFGRQWKAMFIPEFPFTIWIEVKR